MDPDQDCSPYCIEDTLLLKFLITRFTEMLGMDEPRLVPVCGQGLVWSLFTRIGNWKMPSKP